MWALACKADKTSFNYSVSQTFPTISEKPQTTVSYPHTTVSYPQTAVRYSPTVAAPSNGSDTLKRWWYSPWLVFLKVACAITVVGFKFHPIQSHILVQVTCGGISDQARYLTLPRLGLASQEGSVQIVDPRIMVEPGVLRTHIFTKFWHCPQRAFLHWILMHSQYHRPVHGKVSVFEFSIFLHRLPARSVQLIGPIWYPFVLIFVLN